MTADAVGRCPTRDQGGNRRSTLPTTGTCDAGARDLRSRRDSFRSAAHPHRCLSPPVQDPHARRQALVVRATPLGAEPPTAERDVGSRSVVLMRRAHRSPTASSTPMPPFAAPSATPATPSDGEPFATTAAHPRATTGMARHRIQRPSTSPATIAVGITRNSVARVPCSSHPRSGSQGCHPRITRAAD